MLVMQNAGAQLPQWLGNEEAEYLEGGVTDVNIAEHLSFDDFAEGQMQHQLEGLIGNAIPAKAVALRENARLQRGVIEASNSLFNWRCYPSYFDQKVLYVPEVDAMSDWPITCSEEKTERLKTFAQGVRAVALENPGRRFAFMLADHMATSSANPASEYVSSQFTTQMAVEILAVELGDLPNVIIASEARNNIDDFYQYHFKSDHHWNAMGALVGANILGEHLAWDHTAAPGTIPVAGPTFNGTWARIGLTSVGDAPRGMTWDYSDVSYEWEGSWYNGTDHFFYEDESELAQRFTFYNDYWIKTPELTGPGTKKALLLCDSYGDAFRLPMAKQYASVSARIDLHGDTHDSPDTLRSRIEEFNPDDVIFLGFVNNFIYQLDRNPEYFK